MSIERKQIRLSSKW